MRWLLVAIVLVCCAGMVGQAGDVPPEFRLFADAPVDVFQIAEQGPVQMDPAFNLFSDATPVVQSTVPNEIEVEIWVREQCSACDQWFRNIKEDAAKRRSGMIAANEPRVRWVVRTDDPPKQVAAFPYWRFVIGGRVFEATGNTSPGGVIHDYRKWLATFRQ